jgi:hypothetical protein
MRRKAMAILKRLEEATPRDVEPNVDERVPGQDPVDTIRLAGRGGRDLGAGHPAFLGIEPSLTARSDNEILEQICGVLGEVADLNLEEIEVAVWGGGVTLRGTVPRIEHKIRAGELVSAVEGVQDLRNELQVLDV